MPRDVTLGEGYTGPEMVSVVMPGQHQGKFSVDTGRSVLIRHGFTYSDNGEIVYVENDIDNNWSDDEDKSFAYGRVNETAQVTVVGKDDESEDEEVSLGDIKADIARIIASGELDQLMRGVRNSHDALISTIKARESTLENYKRAKTLLDEAKRLFGPTFVTIGLATVPNPKHVPFLQAFSSSSEASKFFARQIQTLQELEIVFSKVAEALSASGLKSEADAVMQFVRQSSRFTLETDGKFALVPEYRDTKLAIITAFKRNLSSAGVKITDYSNPKWFESYMAAAESVVPLPKSATVKDGTGISGLGNLGLTPPIIALITLVSAVVATVAVIHGINKLSEIFNSKAETSRQLILQRDKEWAKMEAEMRARGVKEQEIQTARANWDAQTKNLLKEIPDPPSAAGILGKVALILGGLVIGGKAIGVI